MSPFSKGPCLKDFSYFFLQGIKDIPPWEKENHLQKWFLMGYVSSLKGILQRKNPQPPSAVLLCFFSGENTPTQRETFWTPQSHEALEDVFSSFKGGPPFLFVEPCLFFLRVVNQIHPTKVSRWYSTGTPRNYFQTNWKPAWVFFYRFGGLIRGGSILGSCLFSWGKRAYHLEVSLMKLSRVCPWKMKFPNFGANAGRFSVVVVVGREFFDWDPIRYIGSANDFPTRWLPCGKLTCP